MRPPVLAEAYVVPRQYLRYAGVRNAASAKGYSTIYALPQTAAVGNKQVYFGMLAVKSCFLNHTITPDGTPMPIDFDVPDGSCGGKQLDAVPMKILPR